MKLIFVIAGLLLLNGISCKKKTGDVSCEAVTITQSGIPCTQWGIKVNSITYPSANIPLEFQVEGRFVCAAYELYEDMRLCACCGGAWADIKSIKNFTR